MNVSLSKSWTAKISTAAEGPPVPSGFSAKRLVIGGGQESRDRSGTSIWISPSGNSTVYELALHELSSGAQYSLTALGDHLLVAYELSLVAIDLATFSILWSKHFSSIAICLVPVHEDKILVLQEADITLFSSGGDMVWTHPIGFVQDYSVDSCAAIIVDDDEKKITVNLRTGQIEPSRL